MLPADLEQELERLHPQSFAWSLACCDGRREEAEEVLQSTYLKVLEGRARFDGRSSLKTWLFAVIRRTAAGVRRRAATRRWLLRRWVAREVIPGPPAAPDEALWRRERMTWVRGALAVLSPRQRQVLELVFVHDLTLSEAARVLGVSLGTVSAHYARGKSALQTALAAKERA